MKIVDHSWPRWRNLLGRVGMLVGSLFGVASEGLGQTRAATGTAAAPTVEHLSVSQGLSHNSVQCVYQDSQGFLWVGTRDGLNKYDGYGFTHFSPDPVQPATTIGHSWITAITEDLRGQLWVATLGGGLYRLDKQTGQASGYLVANNAVNPRNTCFAQAQDAAGNFWIGTAGGLNQFAPRTGRFTLHPAPDPARPAVFAVAIDNAGRVWVGGATGLAYFNPRTNSYVRVNPSTPADSMTAVFAIYPGRAGELWVAAKQGLYQVRPGGATTLYRPPQAFALEERVLSKPLWQDASGILWTALSDQSGLQRFDPVTRQWTVYRARPAAPGALSSNQIFALYRDRSGILWVGSDNGLDALMPQAQAFRTVQFRADAYGTRLPQNGIRALCYDRVGTVWVSNSLGQLATYESKTGQLTPYAPAALKKERVNAILEDYAGRLWLGTDHALLCVNQQTQHLTRYLCNTGVRTMRQAPDGTLWIGGRGVAAFSPATAHFHYYPTSPQAPDGLRSAGIVAVLPTREGVVWIATNDVGLVKLDPATQQFTYYPPGAAGCPNDKDIRTLYEDGAGVLWVGTNQGGLNRRDPKLKTFTALTTHDGLPSNHVAGILADTLGNLWLATNQGLCRFTTRDRACRTYDQRDGLQDNVFSEACAQGTAGELLFGGPNGFNLFSPTRLRDNHQVPPVYITGLLVLNKPRLLAPRHLSLPHQENLLSFNFVALNFIRPEKNQYAYQLVGVDEHWLYCGTRRFVTYSNLAPGDYVFRVKAANNDGVWNDQGTALSFTIRPPFWRTAWFIALAMVVAASVTYGGFQFRIRQVRREEAQKKTFHQQLVEMELQALRAQMSPHFIFNALNSINSFILDNEPEAASDYLVKFSKLIRLILQHSAAATIPLAGEVEALRLYLSIEALRFGNKLTFAIEVGPEVDAEQLKIPPLLLQPYVENAVWHGLLHQEYGGHLALSFRQQDGYLCCAVEDNGVGRARAAVLKSKSATRHKSLGMQLTAHRLALSNLPGPTQATVTITDLADAAGRPVGTRVVLRLPVGPAATYSTTL